jgi:hypothetical protein
MNDKAEVADTGMELRDLLSDEKFLHRKIIAERDGRRFEALDTLAHVFAEAPDVVLQKLVDIAVKFCGADSAGISLEESGEDGEQHFRWIVIAGSFAQYVNGTTPRFFSPCGTCLSSGRPHLFRVTKPYYDFLGVAAEPITDGVLIPWTTESRRGTIWAVAHHSREAFDFNDYRLLNSLADFAAIAIRYQSQEENLRRHDRQAASSARAHELAHEINNPLQSLTNTLYLASQSGPDTQLYVNQACQELNALSEKVRNLLSLSGAKDRLPQGSHQIS